MPSTASLRAPAPPVKSCLPFAALPHELRRDRRLNPRAIVTAATLLEYARAKAECWPTVGRLADDMGIRPRAVQLALAALRAAGWIDVIDAPDKPAGRVFRLLWGGARDCAPPAQGIDEQGAQEIAPEWKNEREKERPSSDEGSSSPSPTAGEIEQFLAWADGPDPVKARFGRAALKLAGVDAPPPCPAPEPPPAQAGPMPPPLENKGAAGDPAPETADPVPCLRQPSATPPRGDAGPRAVAPVAAQVPRPVATTMRKAPATQRCVSGPSQLREGAIQWPLNRPAGVPPPARPPAGP